MIVASVGQFFPAELVNKYSRKGCDFGEVRKEKEKTKGSVRRLVKISVILKCCV